MVTVEITEGQKNISIDIDMLSEIITVTEITDANRNINIGGFEYPAGTEYITWELQQPRVPDTEDTIGLGIVVELIASAQGSHCFDYIYNGSKYEVSDDLSGILEIASARTLSEPLERFYLVSLQGWDKLKAISTIQGGGSLIGRSNFISYSAKMTNLEVFNPYYQISLPLYGILQNLPSVKSVICAQSIISDVLHAKNLPTTLESLTIDTALPWIAASELNENTVGHLANLKTLDIGGGQPIVRYRGGAQNWQNIENVRFSGVRMVSADVDQLIIDLAAGGVTNGTLFYGDIPTSTSFDAYGLLVERNWNITGTPPPAPLIDVTTFATFLSTRQFDGNNVEYFVAFIGPSVGAVEFQDVVSNDGSQYRVMYVVDDPSKEQAITLAKDALSSTAVDLSTLPMTLSIGQGSDNVWRYGISTDFFIGNSYNTGSESESGDELAIWLTGDSVTFQVKRADGSVKLSSVFQLQSQNNVPVRYPHIYLSGPRTNPTKALNIRSTPLNPRP